MQSLLILGRQPELGLAELAALYGPDKIQAVGDQAVLVDVDPCNLDFSRLGGSLKLAKHLTTLDATDWAAVLEFLVKVAPDHSKDMPAGKMTLGLSLYGFNLSLPQLSKDSLKIKRAIQSTERSVRLVPNRAMALNSAQVIFNKLTSSRAWELLVIKDQRQTYLAQTVMVQDIKGYADRDRLRPERNPKIGMLPPKLAQIIINLASGPLLESNTEATCLPPDTQLPRPALSLSLLDPFCGSGVILQEAALMGYRVIGSDLNPQMVTSSKNNLKWLADKYRLDIHRVNILSGDATSSTWPKFDFVASETNLGQPLSSRPSTLELEQMSKKLNDLIRRALLNIASQLPFGGRLCFALPAWPLAANEFQTLPLIDHLAELGYNSMAFKDSKPLIYYRPGQYVGRQLLSLIRK